MVVVAPSNIIIIFKVDHSTVNRPLLFIVIIVEVAPTRLVVVYLSLPTTATNNTPTLTTSSTTKKIWEVATVVAIAIVTVRIHPISNSCSITTLLLGEEGRPYRIVATATPPQVPTTLPPITTLTAVVVVAPHFHTLVAVVGLCTEALQCRPYLLPLLPLPEEEEEAMVIVGDTSIY